MNYEIKLLDLSQQPTLSLRTISPVEKLPEFFGKAYSSIMAYLQELNEVPSGMPFATYYNLDMSALDIEAGFPVEKTLPAQGEILSTFIPAGKYITTVHTGPYDSMKPAYDALTKWAQANGYTPSGIAYEFYLNDPSENPDIVPLTEIRFPVNKK
jgi:effector-binding domain-containing protein